MKRRLIVPAVLAFCLASLVGCGNEPLEGEWKLEEIYTNNETLREEELEAYYGGEMIYHFSENGTVEAHYREAVLDGTWEQEDKKVSITFEGISSDFELKGDELIRKDETSIYTVVKQK